MSNVIHYDFARRERITAEVARERECYAHGICAICYRPLKHKSLLAFSPDRGTAYHPDCYQAARS